MNRLKLILFVFLSLIYLPSCREFTDEKYISEGIIEYEISYPETATDNIMLTLMPKEMTFKFKKDKISIDFTGGLGMFKATFISDLQEKNLIHMVKILNKKYAITFNQDEINTTDELPEMDINYTKETKDIAGYSCKRAIISFTSDKHTSFDVWFTEDINLTAPNWSTPYKDVKGVLMEYQLKRYDVEMRFTAKSVEKTEIDDSEFIRPDDYKIITKKEMDEIFLTLK
jgi:GLPGLI family protein